MGRFLRMGRGVLTLSGSRSRMGWDGKFLLLSCLVMIHTCSRERDDGVALHRNRNFPPAFLFETVHFAAFNLTL